MSRRQDRRRRRAPAARPCLTYPRVTRTLRPCASQMSPDLRPVEASQTRELLGRARSWAFES